MEKNWEKGVNKIKLIFLFITLSIIFYSNLEKINLMTVDSGEGK